MLDPVLDVKNMGYFSLLEVSGILQQSPWSFAVVKQNAFTVRGQ